MKRNDEKNNKSKTDKSNIQGIIYSYIIIIDNFYVVYTFIECLKQKFI